MLRVLGIPPLDLCLHDFLSQIVFPHHVLESFGQLIEFGSQALALLPFFAAVDAAIPLDDFSFHVPALAVRALEPCVAVAFDTVGHQTIRICEGSNATYSFTSFPVSSPPNRDTIPSYPAACIRFLFSGSAYIPSKNSAKDQGSMLSFKNSRASSGDMSAPNVKAT